MILKKKIAVVFNAAIRFVFFLELVQKQRKQDKKLRRMMM